MKIEKFKIRREWKYGDSRNGLLCVYRNEKLVSETPYEDGKIHGKVKTYFENGLLESEQEYYKGICNGKSINYDRRGNIMQTYTYEDGILIRGKSESYDPHEYSYRREFF